MSTDPYHAVQSEIQGALQAAGTLRASFRRIRSTARADSEELAYARNELKAALTALEADLDDLDESVRMVERAGGRAFGIGDDEVISRRRYVRQVRGEVEALRAEVAAPEASGSARAAYAAGPTVSTPEAAAEDEQAAWSRAEQQMIVQEQDHTLSSISGTLTTLAEQAGLIGREVGEHNEVLGDLESNVDRTDTKLSGAMKRMQHFIRQTEDTKSGWCIAILIAILLALLLAVILV